MGLKILLSLILSVYYLSSFSQGLTSGNINSDTMIYELKSDSNYINDSNYSIYIYTRASTKFPMYKLLKSDFNPDSITAFKKRVRINFMYQLDSSCKAFDLRVINKTYSRVNYEYATRKLLTALNSIPHKILLNGSQQSSCSFITNLPISIFLEIY